MRRRPPRSKRTDTLLPEPTLFRSEAGRAMFEEARASVLPKAGFRSRIALRDSVLKLVAEGIIDPERFASVYQGRGGLPVEVRYMLIWATHLPIHLTEGNADYYVNLLWPLGLAT